MNLNVRIQRTKRNELPGKIVGLCIKIHHELGPGLLESADEECLAYELSGKTPADIVSPSVPLWFTWSASLESVYICENLWLKKFPDFLRRLAWIRAD